MCFLIHANIQYTINIWNYLNISSQSMNLNSSQEMQTTIFLFQIRYVYHQGHYVCKIKFKHLQQNFVFDELNDKFLISITIVVYALYIGSHDFMHPKYVISFHMMNISTKYPCKLMSSSIYDVFLKLLLWKCLYKTRDLL